MSSDDWFTALVAACVAVSVWIVCMLAIIYAGSGLG
jgi:hypothetical protein